MEFATFPANSTQNKSLFRTVGSAHTWQMVIGVWMCWAGNVCALQSPWIIWQRQWGVTGEQYSPFPFWNTLNFPEPPLELEMRTHKPCPVSKSLSGSMCELNILRVWTVRLALVLTQVPLSRGPNPGFKHSELSASWLKTASSPSLHGWDQSGSCS